MLATMHHATWTTASQPGRNSIGGHPYLPTNVSWPVCPKSGNRMVLFLQFDVAPEYGLALAPGSHVLAFHSPTVNEINTFERNEPDMPAYWAKREPHYQILIFGPEAELVEHPDEDGYLVPHALTFEPVAKVSDPFFYLGGQPRWYQDDETKGDFAFIGMLSENFPFVKKPEAPKQPGTFDRNAYSMFLGNATYFFARARPTVPDEVYVVLQN